MCGLHRRRTLSPIPRGPSLEIHFRGSARYLILLLEFQSKTYRYMPVRILYYVAIAYHSLVAAKARRRKLAPGGLLPPTLAVTIYNGSERWTAPDEVLELIEPTQGWPVGSRRCATRSLTCGRWSPKVKQREASCRGWRAWSEFAQAPTPHLLLTGTTTGSSASGLSPSA